MSELKVENNAIALDKLKPLAWLGDKTAQELVGYLYASGMAGVTKNDTEAIYWFRRCASFSLLSVPKDVDPAAQYELNVAKFYASGKEGFKVDPVESAKWLKLAAEGGSKEAAEMLAKSRP